VQDVLTFLLTEFDPRSQPPLDRSIGELLRETVEDAGGDLVETEPSSPAEGGTDAAPPAVLAAVFHVAGDAAVTAVKLSRLLTESPETAVRMALCTGEVADDGVGTGARAPALTRATELLRFTAPQQILATASTAVMASPALPTGAELVDRGIRVLGRQQTPERIYELRSGRAGLGGDHDDDGASNLEWARRAARGPVLGREEPLDALALAWKSALHGNRRTVLLAGEGGIGKTTVAAELALRLHADGALVLYGRWDQQALAPYQAVREALGTYAAACPTARLRADLEGWGDEITRLLPDVGARVGGVRAPLMGDPDGERMRLFEAIEAWLAGMARRRPVVLVLDDLHWADGSSRLLVEHLRHAPHDAPLMMVLTSRVDETEPGLDLLGITGRTGVTRALGATSATGAASDDEGTVELIGLAGLERAAVARLVEQAIGRPLDDEDEDLVEWLSSETSGNPLFVQEVLRSVSGSRDAAAALRTARREVPDRLADVVRWRLRQLPAPARLVLADAAVIGTAFDLDLLSGATALPPVQLTGPIDHALRSGLLRHHTPGARYAFAHEVVQRALRDDLDADRTRGLHRRIAATLAERSLAGNTGVTAGEVAYHHLRGADASTAEPAIRWARTAADAARRETAFEAAVSLLTRAVEVHDTLVRPFAVDGGELAYAAAGCELRLELAEARDRAGEFTARDQAHREAADQARRLDRTDLLVRAALGYGGRLPQAPPINPFARGLLEEALERMPDEDSRNRALLLARLAQTRYFDADYDERRAWSDEAVAMARRLDAPVVVAQVLMARCLTLDGPDDHAEQLEVGTEITRIGRQTGDPDLVLQGVRACIPSLLVLGRHDEVRRQAETFVELANEVRHPDHLRIARMWEILWMGLEGRYDEAEVMAEELRRRLVASGHSQSHVIYFIQTFGLRWLRGDVERCRDFFDQQLDPLYHGWPGLDILRMWLEASDQNFSRAQELLPKDTPARYLAHVSPDYMWWLTIVALRLTATASNTDPAWAAALYDALLPYRGHNVVVGYTAFFGAVDHHLGSLALAMGRLDEAVNLLDDARDQHRRLGAEPFLAFTTSWLERALVARDQAGDRERAEQLHDESEQLVERYGLQRLP
jgi:tetratricopeptide (TPR) repeat protein